jgi:DNA transformation protein
MAPGNGMQDRKNALPASATMKHDSALSDHILDLLTPLGGVTRRYMFGGWGFYKDTLFFALIADGRFYLKTGPCNVQEFLDAALDQWTYPTDKGPMKMSYHAAPEAALENPRLMLTWAKKGLAAAKEAAEKKKKKKRSKK